MILWQGIKLYETGSWVKMKVEPPKITLVIVSLFSININDFMAGYQFTQNRKLFSPAFASCIAYLQCSSSLCLFCPQLYHFTAQDYRHGVIN